MRLNYFGGGVLTMVFGLCCFTLILFQQIEASKKLRILRSILFGAALAAPKKIITIPLPLPIPIKSKPKTNCIMVPSPYPVPYVVQKYIPYPKIVYVEKKAYDYGSYDNHDDYGEHHEENDHHGYVEGGGHDEEYSSSEKFIHNDFSVSKEYNRNVGSRYPNNNNGPRYHHSNNNSPNSYKSGGNGGGSYNNHPRPTYNKPPLTHYINSDNVGYNGAPSHHQKDYLNTGSTIHHHHHHHLPSSSSYSSAKSYNENTEPIISYSHKKYAPSPYSSSNNNKIVNNNQKIPPETPEAYTNGGYGVIAEKPYTPVNDVSNGGYGSVNDKGYSVGEYNVIATKSYTPNDITNGGYGSVNDKAYSIGEYNVIASKPYSPNDVGNTGYNSIGNDKTYTTGEYGGVADKPYTPNDISNTDYSAISDKAYKDHMGYSGVKYIDNLYDNRFSESRTGYTYNTVYSSPNSRNRVYRATKNVKNPVQENTGYYSGYGSRYNSNSNNPRTVSVAVSLQK